MSGVLARILLRYIAGALVAKGVLSDDLGASLSGDADILSAVSLGLGAVIGAATEVGYWLAKRFGWST